MLMILVWCSACFNWLGGLGSYEFVGKCSVVVPKIVEGKCKEKLNKIIYIYIYIYIKLIN